MNPILEEACAIASIRLDSSKKDFKSRMADLMEKNPAHKDYYGGILAAREQMEKEDLLEHLGEDFEYRYSASQVALAVILTREDAASMKNMQFSLLQRLDTMLGNQHLINEKINAIVQSGILSNKFSWVVSALLLYIAIRVS